MDAQPWRTRIPWDFDASDVPPRQNGRRVKAGFAKNETAKHERGAAPTLAGGKPLRRENRQTLMAKQSRTYPPGLYPAVTGLTHARLDVCALSCLMASYKAARGSSNYTMMAGIVASRASDDGTL